MRKFIIIGAVIGSLIGWVMNFSVLTGLVLGAIVGGIIYSMTAKRNTDAIEEEKKESAEHTMQLREEQLDIKKERIQTGEVKIHKEVVEEQKTFTIPIRRQELVIEAGSDEEFRIPLKEEEVAISKHPVQLNDVSISKRQVEKVEQVKEMIKKETALFEVKGDADVKENERHS